jgi:hypothetical protein
LASHIELAFIYLGRGLAVVIAVKPDVNAFRIDLEDLQNGIAVMLAGRIIEPALDKPPVTAACEGEKHNKARENDCHASLHWILPSCLTRGVNNAPGFPEGF